ncbi:MAG: precorrin-3B C(17)-methyltransferase [Methanomicrobiales archaeon]|nr:precorrin-3B C(17)-methyltransferase [Methanomicrobiales archaeon]NYT20220.1 precorrin-3B C(17)-methyltransferase [Methanomicrobiales archaeon]
MPSHGRLAIVGIGPGSPAQLTGRAREVLEQAAYVIGNDTYLAQLGPLLEGKKVITSSMGKEVERARRSIELAREAPVVMVSGGDAGIYGMAGIVLEILERDGVDLPWEVVPGITASQAAASILGSPLSGDFATLSLSDLLTPLEVIERRLHAAFSMGVPVVLYNPRSRGRPHNFALAMEIAGEYRSPATPVGIVRNAYRDGEEAVITTLGEISGVEGKVDMHTTVIVGGEETRIWRNGEDVRGIITPRGYHRKYLY